MVNQLRQLVRRFIAGQVQYGPFRNEFVRFMAASDVDANVEALFNNIEAACSALDHGFISEANLRARLRGSRIVTGSTPVPCSQV